MFSRVARVGRINYAKFHYVSPVTKLPNWNYEQNTIFQTAPNRILLSVRQIRDTKINPDRKFKETARIFPSVGGIDTANNTSTAEQNDWVQLETRWHKFPKIYMALSKWYLTLFVAMTADAGYCLAPVMFDQKIFVLATVGTVLCSCSANTFNQISEVQYDALMDRTKTRPLVRKLISPQHATMFGISSGIAGVSCLYFGVNGLTAALGFANILLYAGIYTPMKRRHWLNTWAGSIVGAIPPIMGWTAATGSLDLGALILAGILYAWQFPHFFALAWRRKSDYARGSYHMLPLSHPEATKHVVLGHSLALCGLSIAAPLTGVTSWAFVALSAPFNAWLMVESVQFHRKGNSQSAMKLYKCSLYYILAISLALVVDRKVLSRMKTNSKAVESS